MKKRNERKRASMKWDVMDIRDMTYEDATFDLIIDKATLDCIACNEASNLDVAFMLKEC